MRVNAGPSAWAFAEHAETLAAAFGVPVSMEPAPRSYLLGWDGDAPTGTELFIPWTAVVVASDKRLQTEVFHRAGVSTPRICSL